jgi:DNA-binding NarL/FixJ family response regulator
MKDFTSAKQTINVLLIDDHQMILDGLAALISSENETIKVVGRTSDSEQIASLARELDPDVILLDLDLGKNKDGTKICGLDFLPQLATESKAKVLILTGESDIALHAEAISRGAKGVVLKNAPGEIIIQAIKKIAAGQRWHSDEIIDYMTTHHKKGASSDKPEDLDSENIATLTPMQLRVIATITANVTMPNKQIANLLRISEHTLKNHLTEINSKLYTKNKMDLFMFAKRHNLDKISF